MMRKPKPTSKHRCLLMVLVRWCVAVVVVFGAPACGGLRADQSILHPIQNKPIIHVYVGENITLHCTKLNNIYGSVKFYIGDDIVSGEYVTVVNSTYARLDRPALYGDRFSNNVQCRDDGVSGEIGATPVYIDYRPQKPVNLTHFVWYNKDAFIFTWDLGVPAYKSPGQQNPNIPQTVITAEYSYAGKGWTICTADSGSDGQTSCQVKVTDALERRGVSLRVNVTNRVRNDTETAIFNVSNISDHVKPKPADKLNVVALNSSCVGLTWYSKRALMKAQLTTYISIPLDTRTEEVPESEDENGSYKHFTCGLHPAYNYTFEVRIMPKVGGYPSEPRNFSLQMPEDVPASGPRVLRSGYQRRHCSLDKKLGELTVYFKPVPEKSQNGKIVNYTAQFGTNDTTTQSASDGLYFSRRVPCDRGLNVTLYASGRLMLQSPPSEQLYIPPLDEVEWLQSKVRDMDLLVGKSEMHATATWTAPSADAWDNTLLLYYCYNSTDSESCKDDIDYVEVNTTECRHSLQATNNRKFEASARFGLAATTPGNRASGIVYTKCTYSLMKENVEPEPITLTATASLTSINVYWPSMRCDGKRIIWNYVIGYCSVRLKGDGVCSSGKKLIEVSGKTTNGYSLQDVEQGKMYMITVQANTSSSASLYFLGQPVYAELLVYSLNPSEWAGVGISVLLVVLSLGCLVSCAVRRRYREAKEKMITTNDPALRKMPPVKPSGTTREQNGVPPIPPVLPAILNGGETERNVSVPVKKTPLLPSTRVPLGDKERLLNGSVPMTTRPTMNDGETTRKTTIGDDETTAKTPADPPCQPPVTPPGLAETPLGYRDLPVSGKPEKSTATPSPCNTHILNAEGYVEKNRDPLAVQQDDKGEDTNKHKNAKAEAEGLNQEWENTLGPSEFIEYFDKDQSSLTPLGLEDHASDRTTSKNDKTSLLIQPNGLGTKNIFNRHLGNGGCLIERVKDINYGARKQNTPYLSNSFPPQPAGLRFSTAELDTDGRDIKKEDHSELLGVDATNLCKDLPTRCKQNTCYLPNGCLQGSPSGRLEDLSDRSDWQHDDDRGNDNDYGNRDGNHDEVERKSVSMQRTAPYVVHTQVDMDCKEMMAKYTTDTNVVSQDVLTKQMTFQNEPSDQKTQATARGPYVDVDDRLGTGQFVRSDSGYHSLAGRQLSVLEPTSP